jgi:surfactin family lipopeptide synthetase A
MTTDELLSELMARDVRVWAEEGRLHLSAPKGVLTAELQEELSSRKREILSYLQMAREVADRQTPAIRPASRGAPLELSFGQERLWFLHHLEPENTAYNIPAEIRFREAVDLNDLEWSLSELVRRHEILRTAFPEVDGRPVQAIQPPRPCSIPCIDLTGLSGAALAKEIERHKTSNGRDRFDMTRGPLWRAVLLRLSEEDYRLLFTQHHVITDRWSLGVLVAELRALYRISRKEMSSPLPDLPIQYADFSVWQRQWLQGDVLEEHLSYWKERLNGTLPMVELPLDRPRPAVQTHSGSWESVVFPAALAGKLKELSRGKGATLFMTLLAAFQVLIHRYTGLDDVIVGSPIAGRNQRVTEGLIGFFVNTLILRTDLSGDPSFGELLGRVRQVALGAYVHQDIPFEKLVEELRPERNFNLNPFFQLMIALQNAPLDEKADDVTFSAAGGSMMDLTLFLVDAEPGLIATAEYNADLFDRSTVVRLLEHYRCLLEDIVANPDRRISQLQLLPGPERRRLLEDVAVTKSGPVRSVCLHEWIEEQVARRPEATALVCGEKAITYLELDRRANQLAHYLRKLGVGPEILVAVFLDRSIETVVALLGIMKAGGAYVPIDPTYPRERVRFMLEDAQAKVLITEGRFLTELPPTGAHVVVLDRCKEAIEKESDAKPETGVTPDNLVYVLYTSGSTGRPKGTALVHSNTVALTEWTLDEFDAEELSGVLAATSLCFDVSVFELFCTLCRGGRVILVENALALPSAPRAGDVRLCSIVPSVMAELLLNGGVPDTVHTILLAGEPLPEHLLRQVFEKTRARRVLNVYGPTEDTTYSTYYTTSVDGPIAIGRPIRNTQVYILDDQLEPKPMGVPGEVYFGGDGLARGYFGRPEQTAEKFLPNPFSSRPGSRLYRTGDLARFLPNGDIDFLGRRDYQVKVRGFRIELGEIEHVLLRHEAVKSAVVLVRDNGIDDKKLVAYVVYNSGAEPTVTELRQYLKDELPSYMVPSMFVILDAIPLSPNGKIDRRALSDMDNLTAAKADAQVLPRTDMERSIAEIWKDLLKVDNVSVHDNFFDLGGHSLLSIRVIARIEKQYGVRLGIREFMFQTLEQCAASCEGMLDDRANGGTKSIGKRILEALRGGR